MSGDVGTEPGLVGLGQAFAMIVASEIGDKTFFIAAILAMRHDRLVVFAGAFGSLLVMSLLSAAMGRVLPSVLPKKYTQFAAALLFLVFGLKMLREGRDMNDNEKMSEEMREAEEEIDLEDGQSGGMRAKADFRRTCGSLLGPVLAQSFLLTFLGEWGDRSQIATIALAAAHDMFLVALGTVIGHACCTALAVIGGRWVSKKISIKHVTLCGGLLFLLFAMIYFVEALYEEDIRS